MRILEDSGRRFFFLEEVGGWGWGGDLCMDGEMSGISAIGSIESRRLLLPSRAHPMRRHPHRRIRTLRLSHRDELNEEKEKKIEMESDK